MTIGRAVFVYAGALLSGVTMSVTSRPVNTAAERPTFYPVVELTTPMGVAPTLRGARIADTTQWPASFYSVQKGQMCSSDLIGPRTLLTAAHCVDEGGTVTLQLSGQQYRGVCNRSPDYVPGAIPKADIALCAFDGDVPATKFEVLNASETLVSPGRTVLLTGFGCTNDDGTGNDHVFREGDAAIQSHANSGPGSTVIQVKGEAALCFGDSGGGTFVRNAGSPPRRVQIAVNSAVSQNSFGILTDVSFLSDLAAPAINGFILRWAAQHHAGICGIDTSLARCG